MYDYIEKHLIKSWIDNSNWPYWTKRDLKIIVDISRTVDEVILGMALYPYLVHRW